MDIVFMGTPDFAVPSLKKLIERYNVKAVFTQPDRPKGRGKKLSKSPVKEVAVVSGIDVYQPEKLKSDRKCLDALKSMKPDFIVVVAYGQILTREVLDIPKYGCINLHASLLPKYRGAAPINWCIINGERETGNTTMFMDEGLDTGDILLASKVQIGPDMTAGQLHDILMEDGADLLIKTIDGIINGTVQRKKQGESTTDYAKMLNKSIANINWESNAKDIKNFVRGLNPWPVAYTKYKGKTMKVYRVSVLDEIAKDKPGTLINVSEKGIKVCTMDKVILIDKIQFPGKRAMEVSEFIRGNSIESGLILGT
ncbi:methionyl-tRNA formyltransferase [Clostridium sp. cel8]|jgi:methionyl-tRNA formyltransferase|uniref:methionyl-tRNA formyltransferase n=1 Tax=unclassified Clostridium TaxID=2614128 RepID=UPI0015F48206|nr:methionyl-tRNA formyltransferase [Clostridium sp. cel8]MBA5850522.1 methionyl-tRNA formyltransferase [Clostridium sp. cel8]